MPKIGYKQTREHIKSRFEGKKDTSNENNINWKGDNVSYSGVHKWIYRHLGRAIKCEIADSTCSKKFEWSNMSGTYKRDLDDYRQLCGSHHRRQDGNGHR